MIHISHLNFRYPDSNFELLIDRFEVEEGERVAVIGPSGSGKTTLLNLISGILPTVNGDVSVGGFEVNKLNDNQRRNFRISHLGFIFQDFELLDYLTVMDNILHPYRITKALKLDSKVKKRAADLADQMGIGDKLKRKPAALSQGEQQRVAICRALLPKPRLLLADEATGNLDPENKTKILDLLFKSVAMENATLLAVTHDHELLPKFDRVIDFKEFRAVVKAT
jgi:putative ABC transport system ATP-binding protein